MALPKTRIRFSLKSTLLFTLIAAIFFSWISLRINHLSRTLAGRVDMSFDEVTLNEITQHIEQVYDVPILISSNVSENVIRHETFTVDFQQVRLRDVLESLLSKHELTFVTDEDVILVLTMDEFEDMSEGD